MPKATDRGALTRTIAPSFAADAAPRALSGSLGSPSAIDTVALSARMT